jgi:hypothetical protein
MAIAWVPSVKAAVTGAAAGLVGAAAMAATAKLEQLATNRPDSYVPARTFARLQGGSIV